MGRGEDSSSKRVSLDDLMETRQSIPRLATKTVRKREHGHDIVKHLDPDTGLLHNPNGPALTKTNDKGIVIAEEWAVDGDWTRERGLPAKILRTEQGRTISFQYWEAGQLVSGPEGFKTIDIQHLASGPYLYTLRNCDPETNHWDSSGQDPNEVILDKYGNLSVLCRHSPSGAAISGRSASATQLGSQPDLPAAVTFYESADGETTPVVQSVKFSNYDGLHRENGLPARISFYADGKISRVTWAEHGAEYASVVITREGKFQTSGDVERMFAGHTIARVHLDGTVVDTRLDEIGPENFTPKKMLRASVLERARRAFIKAESLESPAPQ